MKALDLLTQLKSFVFTNGDDAEVRLEVEVPGTSDCCDFTERCYCSHKTVQCNIRTAKSENGTFLIVGDGE